MLTRNKPAYAGVCILDFSMTLMYYFHCNYIKEKRDHKAKLLFTDADSIVSELETNYVYEDFYK